MTPVTSTRAVASRPIYIDGASIFVVLVLACARREMQSSVHGHLQDEQRSGPRLPGFRRCRRRARHPLRRPALRRRPVPRAPSGTRVERCAGLYEVRPDSAAVGRAPRLTRVVSRRRRRRRRHPHPQHLDSRPRRRSAPRPTPRPRVDPRRCLHLRLLGPARLRRPRARPCRSRRGHHQLPHRFRGLRPRPGRRGGRPPGQSRSARPGRRCGGYGTTSPPSVATPATSRSPDSPPAPPRSPVSW